MLENEGATPEVELETQIETPETETTKTMDDTIRDTLRELKSKGAEIENTQETPQSPEEKAQRIRDQKGKFSAEQKTIGADNANEDTNSETVSAAPNTWKKEVAEKWSALPPEVRAEVERREADFHKGIEQYRNKAAFSDSMERAISPHLQTIQSVGMTPDAAVSGLLEADRKLRYGSVAEKQMYFAQLAHSYGIDMANLPAQQATDPNVTMLSQQVQQLQNHIQNKIQAEKQQEEQTLNNDIASFKADPLHSHFDSVKGQMAALLQAGQAKDLADAYEQAVYANPTTRTAMIAQQQAAAKAESAKKAQAAKSAASVNVKIRPSMPVSQPIGTMDDTIRATLRRLQAA